MEHSKALHQIGEAADLIAMIETLTAPNVADPARNAAAWSGLRVTLRNVRENLLSSLETLSADMVNKARARVESQSQQAGEGAARAASPVKQLTPSTVAAPLSAAPASASNNAAASSAMPGNGSAINGARLDRKDLRAQLEKFIDR